MKRRTLVSILFTFMLLLLIPNLAAAMLVEEATKIPYQVNNSDRIVIGTVSKIDTYSSYTIYTVTVKEWLYNPIPAETIKIRSKIGTNLAVEDEVEFTQNESALLMLNDGNLDELLFRVPLGIKYPVSDRDAVIEELKAQGKWQGESQTENKTNDTGMTEKAGTADEKEERSNQTQKPNATPFMNPVSMIAVMLGAIVCLKKKN
ncbi:hypothetical protein [Methanosarcina sp.]|uniref:hypothetical protein n=1 Tax=Methanosarcina sp. TaxID=2213 RepID=UPI0029883421|nr:hypothetical protein [Methanosarcina sp.]MDW5559802.1 hypothetical protein [Methanosarcina sp.]